MADSETVMSHNRRAHQSNRKFIKHSEEWKTIQELCYEDGYDIEDIQKALDYCNHLAIMIDDGEDLYDCAKAIEKVIDSKNLHGYWPGDFERAGFDKTLPKFGRPGYDDYDPYFDDEFNESVNTRRILMKAKRLLKEKGYLVEKTAASFLAELKDKLLSAGFAEDDVEIKSTSMYIMNSETGRKAMEIAADDKAGDVMIYPCRPNGQPDFNNTKLLRINEPGLIPAIVNYLKPVNAASHFHPQHYRIKV